jgi:hypothetical protein
MTAEKVGAAPAFCTTRPVPAGDGRVRRARRQWVVDRRAQCAPIRHAYAESHPPHGARRSVQPELATPPCDSRFRID